ncbi:hypothetical protein DFJ73DRAFT_955898, partial [Zopfochytrium polystomum]
EVASSPRLHYPAIPSQLFAKICLWIPSTNKSSDRQKYYINTYFILDTVFQWGRDASPDIIGEIIAKIASAHFSKYPLSVTEIKKLSVKYGQKFNEALSVELLLQIIRSPFFLAAASDVPGVWL